jgi:hypothetical protein
MTSLASKERPLAIEIDMAVTAGLVTVWSQKSRKDSRPALYKSNIEDAPEEFARARSALRSALAVSGAAASRAGEEASLPVGGFR